jgi:hypothetical protein
LVSSRIQHRLALIQRNSAQILERPLHHRLTILWQSSPLPSRAVDAHALLRRHALQHLVSRQPAIALLLGHLIHLAQLLRQPLLIGGRQTLEARIVAQHPLLVLHRNILVLIQPVSKVALGRGARTCITWTLRTVIRRTSEGSTRIGSPRNIRWISVLLTLHRVPLRAALPLRHRAPVSAARINRPCTIRGKTILLTLYRVPLRPPLHLRCLPILRLRPVLRLRLPELRLRPILRLRITRRRRRPGLVTALLLAKR